VVAMTVDEQIEMQLPSHRASPYYAKLSVIAA